MQLLADENLDADIVRALRRRMPTLDIVRVQEVGLTGVDDPAVLAWAAERGRILVTHDVNTITQYAYQRLDRGEPMPGVVIVPQLAAIARCIDDLLLLVECGGEGDCDGRVIFLPL